VGLALGLVGGGGSILTVPILIYALGENVHLATGTSLAIVGANALVAAWDHARAGRVRLSVALVFGGAGILGALGGAWLNHLAPARLLLLGFAVLMLAAAVAMLRGRLSDQPTSEAQQEPFSPRVLLAGLAVGILTGFFGVGGGFWSSRRWCWCWACPCARPWAPPSSSSPSTPRPPWLGTCATAAST